MVRSGRSSSRLRLVVSGPDQLALVRAALLKKVFGAEAFPSSVWGGGDVK